MISSTTNPHVKQVHALQTKRLAREREGVFVVEGIRWAREVVAAGLPVRQVLHTDHLDERGRGLVNSLARLGAEVMVVSDKVMAACTDTQSPPGILAVCRPAVDCRRSATWLWLWTVDRSRNRDTRAQRSPLVFRRFIIWNGRSIQSQGRRGAMGAIFICRSSRSKIRRHAGGLTPRSLKLAG
jgi:hypothetical protein